MKKAVIYARYSSHRQREESIERQLEICHKFAEDNDFEVIAEYCDREQSGRTDNRLNFQKMMKDAERREFEAVIVLKQDRFARNRADSQMNKFRLAAFNIRVLSATEPIPEGSSGILMEALLEGIAEYYSVELAEKVADGMMRNAQSGLTNGGARTFGYDIEDFKCLNYITLQSSTYPYFSRKPRTFIAHNSTYLFIQLVSIGVQIGVCGVCSAI